MAHPSDNPTPPLHAPDLPSVDAERMEMLRELCLDAGQDMLREMLSSWETEAAKHIANAQTAMSQADTQGLKAAAHALKGSCSNMGIVRLAELGRQLEQQVQAPVIATELIAQMETEFQRTKGLLLEIAGQP